MGKRSWARRFCDRYGHSLKFKVYVYRTQNGTRIQAQEWCTRCGDTIHDEVM